MLCKKLKFFKKSIQVQRKFQRTRCQSLTIWRTWQMELIWRVKSFNSRPADRVTQPVSSQLSNLGYKSNTERKSINFQYSSCFSVTIWTKAVTVAGPYWTALWRNHPIWYLTSALHIGPTLKTSNAKCFRNVPRLPKSAKRFSCLPSRVAPMKSVNWQSRKKFSEMAQSRPICLLPNISDFTRMACLQPTPNTTR